MILKLSPMCEFTAVSIDMLEGLDLGRMTSFLQEDEDGNCHSFRIGMHYIIGNIYVYNIIYIYIYIVAPTTKKEAEDDIR